MHTTSVPRQAKQPKAVRKSGKIKKQAKDRAKGDRANAVPLSERRKKLEEMKGLLNAIHEMFFAAPRGAATNAVRQMQ